MPSRSERLAYFSRLARNRLSECLSTAQYGVSLGEFDHEKQLEVRQSEVAAVLCLRAKDDAAQDVCPVEGKDEIQAIDATDLRHAVGSSDILRRDLEGWLEVNHTKRWCAVADVLMCVFDRTDSPSATHILWLPHCYLQYTREIHKSNCLLDHHHFSIENRYLGLSYSFTIDSCVSYLTWIKQLEKAIQLDGNILINRRVLTRRKANSFRGVTMSNRGDDADFLNGETVRRRPDGNSAGTAKIRQKLFRAKKPTQQSDFLSQSLTAFHAKTMGIHKKITSDEAETRNTPGSKEEVSTEMDWKKSRRRYSRIKTDTAILEATDATASPPNSLDATPPKSPSSTTNYHEENNSSPEYVRYEKRDKIKNELLPTTRMFRPITQDIRRRSTGEMLHTQSLTSIRDQEGLCVEVELPSVMLDDRKKSGVLLHKLQDNWVTRWCEISSGHFNAFETCKNRATKTLLVALPLPKCTMKYISKSELHDQEYGFKLQVTSPTPKEYIFAAANLKDYLEWLRILRKQSENEKVAFHPASSQIDKRYRRSAQMYGGNFNAVYKEDLVTDNPPEIGINCQWSASTQQAFLPSDNQLHFIRPERSSLAQSFFEFTDNKLGFSQNLSGLKFEMRRGSLPVDSTHLGYGLVGNELSRTRFPRAATAPYLTKSLGEDVKATLEGDCFDRKTPSARRLLRRVHSDHYLLASAANDQSSPTDLWLAARDIKCPSFQGYLDMKMSEEDEWVNLWAVVKGHMLYVFTSAIDEHPIDTMDLNNWSLKESCSTNILELKHEVYGKQLLRAESAVEYKSWTSQLRSRCHRESCPGIIFTGSDEGSDVSSEGNSLDSPYELYQMKEQLLREVLKFQAEAQASIQARLSRLNKLDARSGEFHESASTTNLSTDETDDEDENLQNMTGLLQRKASMQLRLGNIQKELDTGRRSASAWRWGLKRFSLNQTTSQSLSTCQGLSVSEEESLTSQMAQINEKLSTIEQNIAERTVVPPQSPVWRSPPVAETLAANLKSKLIKFSRAKLSLTDNSVGQTRRDSINSPQKSSESGIGETLRSLQVRRNSRLSEGSASPKSDRTLRNPRLSIDSNAHLQRLAVDVTTPLMNHFRSQICNEEKSPSELSHVNAGISPNTLKIIEDFENFIRSHLESTKCQNGNKATANINS